jgi:hypothetical protein
MKSPALALRALRERLTFYDVQPSPLDGFEDVFTIGFRTDGTIAFGAGTDAPVRCAARLRDLLALLVAEPSIIEEAVGILGATYHLTGEPLRRLPADDDLIVGDET